MHPWLLVVGLKSMSRAFSLFQECIIWIAFSTLFTRFLGFSQHICFWCILYFLYLFCISLAPLNWLHLCQVSMTWLTSALQFSHTVMLVPLSEQGVRLSSLASSEMNSPFPSAYSSKDLSHCVHCGPNVAGSEKTFKIPGPTFLCYCSSSQY